MMTHVVLTCEHAGRRVPKEYAHLFRGADTARALESHRGWDPGSLQLGKTFQRRLRAPLFCTNVTRLLVEPNRTVGHARLFSEFSAGLDKAAKHDILRRYYYPHRDRVESWIANHSAGNQRVVHLSLHTFTPELAGEQRNADVGLLYDPSRRLERALCGHWHTILSELRPDLRIRRNYPYLGKADGFTTYLRRQFATKRYLGIELEVSQLWLAKSTAHWRRLREDLARSFESARRAASDN